MTLFLQVVLVVVALVVLAIGVGQWLSSKAPPPPFDRCDDPDCPHMDEEKLP